MAPQHVDQALHNPALLSLSNTSPAKCCLLLVHHGGVPVDVALVGRPARPARAGLGDPAVSEARVCWSSIDQ